MTRDHVTNSPHDAEKYERAHGPEHDPREHANEAAESDFTMGVEVRHDDPTMTALYTVIGPPDCPGCGQRCANCDERMCLKYGPAPIYSNGPLVCDRCTTEPS